MYSSREGRRGDVNSTFLSAACKTISEGVAWSLLYICFGAVRPQILSLWSIMMKLL